MLSSLTAFRKYVWLFNIENAFGDTICQANFIHINIDPFSVVGVVLASVHVRR